ncbi:hypothetical protein [Leptothoe spongobia]|uniref:Uncharacterized protein n=1 Tax=Leptothoe spongobia TAU-MAC 1115 TaxID=1967444 RepID=A0A947GKV4_9CYAN|nr:hypothetical protein [Leptothoe spongobia]MBT9316842.1 hypothetical protein [Leptothoe spongobia TAU-MAC 1115]
MTYSDFTLAKVQADFGLTLTEQRDLFAEIKPITPSDLLAMTLAEYLPLAIDINSDKARSEFIIAPVLGDIRRLSNHQVALFSGKEFNVDKNRGLNGFCDFILSRSKEQLYIQSPVMTVIEAKNENLIGGLGQCIAAMVAAQLFNQQANTVVEDIYGAVTTGTTWRFLKLNAQTVWIDAAEHYIQDVASILGILMMSVGVGL